MENVFSRCKKSETGLFVFKTPWKTTYEYGSLFVFSASLMMFFYIQSSPQAEYLVWFGHFFLVTSWLIAQECATKIFNYSSRTSQSICFITSKELILFPREDAVSYHAGIKPVCLDWDEVARIVYARKFEEKGVFHRMKKRTMLIMLKESAIQAISREKTRKFVEEVYGIRLSPMGWFFIGIPSLLYRDNKIFRMCETVLPPTRGIERYEKIIFDYNERIETYVRDEESYGI